MHILKYGLCNLTVGQWIPEGNFHFYFLRNFTFDLLMRHGIVLKKLVSESLF